LDATTSSPSASVNFSILPVALLIIAIIFYLNYSK
jgi:hypothetical protein